MKSYIKTAKGCSRALRCLPGSGKLCISKSRTGTGIPKLLVALLLLVLFGNLKPLYAASGLAAPLQHMPVYADYDNELRESTPRADGYYHVDTPALIAKLIDGHISTYAYLVLHSPSDWDDFRLEFMPAAQAAGINVWLYLAPPTEFYGTYPPYGSDYISWATAAGQLAQTYPNLTGLAIDDFDSNETTPFTPSYVNSMMAAAHTYSPGMAFLPVNYDASHDSNTGKTISTTFVKNYGKYCSGVIFPYLNWSGNFSDYSGESANIAKNASILGSIPMIVMIYDNGYGSWYPDTNYVTQANIIAQAAVAAGTAKGGLIQYKLDKSPSSPQFPIIQGFYVQWATPTYDFTSGFQGWFSGHSLTAATWYNQGGWPGVIYADQTGSDAFFYGPSISYLGRSNDVLQVQVYPQYGATANHQMKLYWTTSTDGTWSESKSTTLVQYVAQNTWATISLPTGTNPSWNNQWITQLRLDVDDNTTNSVGTRWIIDSVYVNPTPLQLTYGFNGGFMGWYSGNGLTAATWYNQGSWPGVIYADQTGANACFHSPWAMSLPGQASDVVQVHVYPQNGPTANHQMKLYWLTSTDGTLNEAKSTPLVQYVAQNAWATVNLPVGGLWESNTITQLQLDLDDGTTNSVGTRWIIDSVNVVAQAPTVQNFWHLGEDGSTHMPADSVGSRAFDTGFGTANVDTNAAPGSTSSLSFGGNGGDYMNAPGISVPADNWVLEAWVYPTSISGPMSILCLGSDVTASQFGIENGKWAFAEFASAFGDNSQTVVTNTWTHLAWVRDSGVNRFFINGVQIGFDTASLVNNGRLHLAVQPGDGRYFLGNVDEIRFSTFVAGGFTPSYLLYNVDGTPGPLKVAKSEGNLTITWTGPGTLQQSANPVGPYSNLTGATSPSSIPLTNAAAFFRVKQ